MFDADFLRERSGQRADAPDPIFIVGLPRSGSTLIEQIIASHSQVEGTAVALFDRIGLDFEPACLAFHETSRAVRTASAEQVRRSISRAGLDQWHRFEPWLGPLEAAPSPAIASYPDAPDQ